MKRMMMALALFMASVSAFAGSKDNGIKIKHEKDFCKVYDCSTTLFARKSDPKGKDKKFAKSFDTADVVFVRYPKK